MSIIDDGKDIVPGSGALLSLARRFVEREADSIDASIKGVEGFVAIDRIEYAVLDALRVPCMPEALSERLQAAGWTMEECEEVPALVSALMERGLLGKLDAILGATERPAASDKLGIEYLAWITKDRPETLKASLTSWGEALSRGQARLPGFVIADDSSDRAADTKAVVERFAASYPGKTYYLDGAFRERMAKAMGADHEDALRFALGLGGAGMGDQGRYGASRNLLLLALAGKTIAMTDDDTFPEFRLHPEASSGFALSSEFDPATRTVFLDATELEAFGLPQGGNPFEPHERLLGLSCRELAAVSPLLDVENADVGSIERLLDNDARVGALCFGSYGDSGAGAARYLLLNRACMKGDPYSTLRYEAAMTNRLVFRAPLRATIGGGSFMGMHVALDARSVLPPFSPFGRNEDGFWAICLYLLHPDKKIAYTAEAVRHRPPAIRTIKRDNTIQWKNRLNDAFTDILVLMRDGAVSEDDRYAFYGDTLLTFEGMSDEEFRRGLSQLFIQNVERKLARFDQELAAYDSAPELWAADIEAAREYLNGSLDDGERWIPVEFSGDAEAYKAYLTSFGKLLLAWPRLFEAATRLSQALLDGVAIVK